MLASARKANPALVSGKVGFVKIRLGINALVRYNDREIVVYCYNRTNEDVDLDASEMRTYCLPEMIADLVRDLLDQEVIAKKDFLLKKADMMEKEDRK